MNNINTTLQLMDLEGKLIDLSVRVLELKPVMSQPSAIDAIADNPGYEFGVGDVLKKNRREQGDITVSSVVGGISNYPGATSQVVGKVSVGITYRTDQIIVSKIDLAKLKEGKGGDLIALDVADFLLTGKEKDTRELLEEATTQADTLKIFTSVGTVNAGDLISVVPTGVQPTQATSKFADAITAIKGGKRSIKVETAEMDVTVEATKKNRLLLLRAMYQYIQKIGSPSSAEGLYPYSINGIGLNELRIVSNLENIIDVTDGQTTNFINITNPDVERSINGMLGYVDKVKVILTNQMQPDVVYKVMSSRVLMRKLDAKTQYIGVVNDSRVAIMKDGTPKNVSPSNLVVSFEQGRTLGVIYPEEIFTLTEGTI